MNRDALKALLIQDEGMRLKPYFDCCGKFFRECTCSKQGKLSIGVGRNIEDNGLSEVESYYLLENDMSRVVAECRDNFAWFNRICDARQNVIASMAFNVGLRKLGGFVKMLGALSSGDFAEAANQMLASLWAAQVGARAVRLAEMMKKGDTFH